MATVSKLDFDFLDLGRRHSTEFLMRMADKFIEAPGKLLEIGVQDHFGARDCFVGWSIHSFDIVDKYSPDIIGDITKRNDQIHDDTYDIIVCMAVLEHTLDPFSAVKEMWRILKPGGHILVSAPLNFRIHGPIPDCWRFTEHGWKVLLQEYDLFEIDILETPDRELFPISYNILAQKPTETGIPRPPLNFRFI